MLRWANLADRMRIKGVREPMPTAQGRRRRYRPGTEVPQSGRLAEAMAEANAKRKRVQLLPSEKRVGRWIEAAKKLPPKISY